MESSFGVAPEAVTLRDCVLPYMAACFAAGALRDDGQWLANGKTIP